MASSSIAAPSGGVQRRGYTYKHGAGGRFEFQAHRGGDWQFSQCVCRELRLRDRWFVFACASRQASTSSLTPRTVISAMLLILKPLPTGEIVAHLEDGQLVQRSSRPAASKRCPLPIACAYAPCYGLRLQLDESG